MHHVLDSPPLRLVSCRPSPARVRVNQASL